ncbi:MAG: hypothetical protein OJF50_004460 [Nitrospira sp.]|nr:hypothetical protein [Nitrospira sp.]
MWAGKVCDSMQWVVGKAIRENTLCAALAGYYEYALVPKSEYS